MDPALRQEYAQFLRGVPLFAGLDRVALAKVAGYLEAIPVRNGTVIVREGDPPDGLYLVRQGRLSVTRVARDGPGEVVLSTCAPGETFGEIGLITGEARSASVRAAEDAEVLWLEQARFRELSEVQPSVVMAIAAQVVHRLRVADFARSAPVTVGVDGIVLATDEVGSSYEHRSAEVSPATRRLSTTPGKAGRLSKLLGVALATLSLLCGWLVPPPVDLDVAGWRALASVLATVPLFATAAVPDGVVALFLVGAWAVGGAAPLTAALSGFTTGSWLLTVVIVIIGAATASTGLVYRLVLWAAAHARRGFRGQVATLALSGLVVSPSFPDATGRTALVAVGTTDLIEALGYATGTQYAVGIAMAVFIGFGLTTAPFLTSSTTTLLTYALLPEAAREGLDWGTWAIRAAPLYLILFPGMITAVIWLYRSGPRGPEPAAHSEQRRSVLALQRALLQSPTLHERIAAIVVLLLVVGFLSAPVHHIAPTWIGLAAFLVLAVSGVLTAESVRAANWNLLVLFGVLASTPQVFAGTRFNVWLGELAIGSLQQLATTPIVFVDALALFCIGLSFLLRMPVAAPFVTLALGPVASKAGIDPWVVAIVALVATCNFVLAYQSNPYQALQHGTGGRLFTSAQTRPLALMYVLLVLVALSASVPAWHAMGLL